MLYNRYIYKIIIIIIIIIITNVDERYVESRI